jgi:hypothetical protein
LADLSQLGGLRPVEPVDLETYVPTRKAKFQLPPRGTYTLQSPESFPAEAFGRSKSGALSISIDPTIVGPTNDGFQIRYQKIYSTTWKDKSGRTVSGIGNYLAAHGVKGVLADEQALADAVEATAGRTYEAIIDWNARRNGFELKGMENFPKNEDGTYQSWVNHPDEKDEEGNPRRVFANLEIVYFIPAKN